MSFICGLLANKNFIVESLLSFIEDERRRVIGAGLVKKESCDNYLKSALLKFSELNSNDEMIAKLTALYDSMQNVRIQGDKFFDEELKSQQTDKQSLVQQPAQPNSKTAKQILEGIEKLSYNFGCSGNHRVSLDLNMMTEKYKENEMRNIMFDESSVLQEFAKIAMKNGLIKEATATPSAQSLPTPEAIVPAPALMSQICADYEKTIKAGSDPTVTFPMFENKLKNIINQLKSNPEHNKLAPIYYPAYVKSIEKLKKIKQDALAAQTSKKSNGAISGDLHAKFADKLYDVSNETAEDLLNNAHSESAKITESDQTVENLIEQQKEDIKVVNKIPTGKYASLIQLADQLDRAGLTSYANKIDSIIFKLADNDANTLDFSGPGETPMFFDSESGAMSYRDNNTVVVNFPETPVNGQKKMLEKDQIDRFKKNMISYWKLTGQTHLLASHPDGQKWADFNKLYKEMGGLTGSESKLELAYRRQNPQEKSMSTESDGLKKQPLKLTAQQAYNLLLQKIKELGLENEFSDNKTQNTIYGMAHEISTKDAAQQHEWIDNIIKQIKEDYKK